MTTTATPETSRIIAANVEPGTRLRHEGEDRTVETKEMSQSGHTARITFADGTTWAPRSTTPAFVVDADPATEPTDEQLAGGPSHDTRAEDGRETALEYRLHEVDGLGDKSIDAALEETGITPAAAQAEPNAEQEKRLAKPKAGLKGKALAIWIITGEGVRSQAEKATGLRQQAKRAAQASSSARGPQSGSMTDAMLTVLKRHRNKPMTAKEVTAEIMRDGLAPNLKGKTPDATVGAKFATEAKKDDGLFERTEPGKFKAR